MQAGADQVRRRRGKSVFLVRWKIRIDTTFYEAKRGDNDEDDGKDDGANDDDDDDDENDDEINDEHKRDAFTRDTEWSQDGFVIIER